MNTYIFSPLQNLPALTSKLNVLHFCYEKCIIFPISSQAAIWKHIVLEANAVYVTSKCVSGLRAPERVRVHSVARRASVARRVDKSMVNYFNYFVL